jgi:hypothetical protein
MFMHWAHMTMQLINLFDNLKLDFSRFESSCYDYGRVYASDSFFDLVKQRHIVLS